MIVTFRLAALAVVASLATGLSAVGATIAQYNLGEDDPGAFAGGAGLDPTVDAIGSNDLTKLGSTTYSSDVPAGGSTLSMSFPGDGGGPGADPDSVYYGNAPWTDPMANITYSFDAKLGTPATSFAFVASLGGNFGGISILETNGEVQIFFPGAGGGDATFNVDDGEWHHFQVDYRWNGGGANILTTLSVDGNVVSSRNGPTANGIIVDALTLAGNWRGTGGIGDEPVPGTETIDGFEGGWNGQIDNFQLSAERVPEPSTLGLLCFGAASLVVLSRRCKK